MTIEDAAHKWVREFNEVAKEMLETLERLDSEDYWEEVTEPAVGNRVWAAGIGKGEITEHNGEFYTIEFEDGEIRDDISEEEIDLVERNEEWPG